MDFVLIGLMLGVWGSFILYGWVLEDIKGTPWGENAERFKDTDFLILAQSLGNVLVSGSLLLALKEGPITHRSATQHSSCSVLHPHPRAATTMPSLHLTSS